MLIFSTTFFFISVQKMQEWSEEEQDRSGA
jgi:hypothetical protein